LTNASVVLSCTYMYRTLKRNTSKLNTLLKQEERVFHTGDLANLWKVKNKNTLYTTIKRYIKRGVLFRAQKGLYSTINPKKLNAVELGVKAVNMFCYLSTESVLAKEGTINQQIFHTTLVSGFSKRFKLEGRSYIVRQMADKYLHNQTGIVVKNNIKTATVERAVADMFYFNSKYYFDNKSRIDWKKVKKIQKEVGFV